MTTVDPADCTCICNSFHTAEDDIVKSLSASRANSANGNWEKWAAFLRDMALEPLLVSYRDPVPILNTFSRKYRTGDITPSGCQVN